jgi:hypothetical protein
MRGDTSPQLARAVQCKWPSDLTGAVFTAGYYSWGEGPRRDCTGNATTMTREVSEHRAVYCHVPLTGFGHHMTPYVDMVHTLCCCRWAGPRYCFHGGWYGSGKVHCRGVDSEVGAGRRGAAKMYQLLPPLCSHCGWPR